MKTPTTLMADFVFGGIESDESRLLESERTDRSGLRHHYAIQPLDPKPGQQVFISAFVGPAIYVDQVSAYVTVDGSDPQGRRGVAQNGFVVQLARGQAVWEPLLWAYGESWQGAIPAQSEGSHVRYRIEGWASFDERISLWSSEPNLDRSVERPTVYGYTVDRFAPPQWAKAAITYQVFVDRFAQESTNKASSPLKISNLQSPISNFPYLPATALNDFWGGTLRGVIDKLDYIAELGVTALWLSPFFLTTSYHGYDTTDYYQVDPRFGSNDDARELIAQAHRRGLRVILDFVANHTSTDFAPFAAALHDPASPQRQWFSFAAIYKHGYRAFFDVATMPQIDLDQPAARQYIIAAAVHWLTQYDADGLRLDYAAGPSHDFWAAFRLACRTAKPDCWLFGEVTRAGTLLRSYSGRLDGCLDFAFCRSIRKLLLATAQTDAFPALPAFVAELERTRRFFGEEFLLPAFIDNHDMNRFLFVAGDDKRLLKLAVSLLLAFGQAPILYYGTEIGLSQPRAKGPWRKEARHPMWWDAAQDSELLAWFKAWITLRHAHPALSEGDLHTLALDAQRGIWLVERRTNADQVLLALNLDSVVQPLSLPTGDWLASDGQPVQSPTLLAAQSITLFAHTGIILP